MVKEEIVTIVDENNNVVGTEPRSKMRAEGLPHRANYILVFNSEGELFLQKRTMSKDIYPGYYDVATGGVVLAGESYDASALRELEEELGIQGVKLKQHFDFFHEDVGNRVWGRVYSCVYDGDIVLQEEEVASGGFYKVSNILEMSTSERFTPDGMYVLQRFIKESSFEAQTYNSAP
jgi:8-oxo-dGTP pyrophosphatase MutT (NUDIX family)